jgi:hypothetical protein
MVYPSVVTYSEDVCLRWLEPNDVFVIFVESALNAPPTNRQLYQTTQPRTLSLVTNTQSSLVSTLSPLCLLRYSLVSRPSFRIRIVSRVEQWGSHSVYLHSLSLMVSRLHTTSSVFTQLTHTSISQLVVGTTIVIGSYTRGIELTKFYNTGMS